MNHCKTLEIVPERDTMNGYERRTKAKKDKILAAALDLFCTYGTEKTSINEIATKAGVAPASIYNYFGSKEVLMKETIINILEDGWRARQELWETDLPFPELIKRAIAMSEEFFDRSNLETMKALFDSNTEIRKLVDDFNRNRYPHIVGKFLEKGRREGYIREEISFEAAMIYLKMFQEVLMQPGIVNNQNKNLMKELVDLMIYGLAGQTSLE
jgi:AcrR family transcriptional regulator